jgi:hypothetical protein
MIRFLFLALLTVLNVSAIAGEPIDAGILKGKINGKDWQGKRAEAKNSPHKQKEFQNNLSIQIGGEDKDLFLQYPKLYFQVPNSIGTYKLGQANGKNPTLFVISFLVPDSGSPTSKDGASNSSPITKLCSKGSIEVLQLKNDMIEIGIFAKIDDDNFVNGRITIPLRAKSE